MSDVNFKKIFILFPDPWPKKKHKKRRLINEEFVKNLDKITPKAVAETITVIAPPQRSDFANTRSGSRNYSNAMKAYKSGSGDYKLLREKEALEVLN